SSKTRPTPSAQTASIWESRLGSIEPESFEMLLVCQSIRPVSLRGGENQAIFAARSPTAIRNFRPSRLRRKQIPHTSRSGTSTTRRTLSRCFFDLPLLTKGGSLFGRECTLVRAAPCDLATCPAAAVYAPAQCDRLGS